MGLDHKSILYHYHDMRPYMWSSPGFKGSKVSSLKCCLSVDIEVFDQKYINI